jgi:hypothetical protein
MFCRGLLAWQWGEEGLIKDDKDWTQDVMSQTGQIRSIRKQSSKMFPWVARGKVCADYGLTKPALTNGASWSP